MSTDPNKNQPQKPASPPATTSPDGRGFPVDAGVPGGARGYRTPPHLPDRPPPLFNRHNHYVCNENNRTSIENPTGWWGGVGSVYQWIAPISGKVLMVSGLCYPGSAVGRDGPILIYIDDNPNPIAFYPENASGVRQAVCISGMAFSKVTIVDPYKFADTDPRTPLYQLVAWENDCVVNFS